MSLGLLLLATLVASACSTRPASSLAEQEPYPNRVQRLIGLYHDADLEARVQRLGYRLARKAGEPPERFSFHIIDQEMPNAFAAPDDTVFLSRGLLTLANDEDALAGILAHELTHLIERHHRQKALRETVPEMLMLPGQTIGGLFGRRVERWINAPMRDLSGLYLSRHSRQLEFEADRKGAILAAAAGYDPMALARILVQMEQTNQLVHQRDGDFSYLDSHPPTEERVERLTAMAHSLDVRTEQRQPAFPTGDDFLPTLDGLCFGPNPAYGVRRGDRYLHLDHGYAISIPAGWSVQRGPNLVGAVAPGQAAAFFLGTSDFGLDPNVPAGEMKQAFYDVYRILPVEEDFRSMENGAVASLLYRDRSGAAPVALLFAWIELDGRIFQFVGSGGEDQSTTLKQVVAQFEPVSAEAKKSVEVMQLRVVRALTGESLSSFSDRTANAWSPAFTAIANDLPLETTFSGGEWLKIVTREIYATPPPVPPQSR